MKLDTLVALLRHRAQERPEALAYGFLSDGEGAHLTISYAELDREARRIAVALADRLAPGSRVLLVYPPGLEFICAFFGALYAGVVAVPAYPPAPPRLEAGVAHLVRIARDCGAEAVLTTAQLAAFREAMPELESLAGVLWIVTDDPRMGEPDAWREPRAGALAFLQYTSGSTSEPKGVMLGHDNLLANLAAIRSAMGLGAHSTFVSWLPMYHDMGLIGMILTPLHCGVPGHLLSPMHFLQRPARWLEAISRFRGTVSGGPNFAYELCTRRVSAEDRASLDLSSWRVAFSGAEPVLASTVHRFIEVFSPAGLDPGAIYPCYGLAEGSLLVAGAEPGAGARRARFAGDELAAGRARRLGPSEPGGVELVSCGEAPPGHEVAILDPEGARPAPPDRVGEIAVVGPSVAAGYWSRPAETERAFGAALPGRPGLRCLRTGDLGFLGPEGLFVTGRIKEVMKIRGRAVYPQDVELATQRADGRLRRGAGCAFSIEVDGQEHAAIVQETTAAEPRDLEDLLGVIRGAVTRDQQVQLAAIALVPPRTVPKTSSGKLRRSACRQLFLASEIQTIAEWRRAGD